MGEPSAAALLSIRGVYSCRLVAAATFNLFLVARLLPHFDAGLNK